MSDPVDPERHVREGRDASPAAAPYPRGIPYRVPDAERLRRRTFFLGVVCALLLVAATAGGTAFLLNLTAPRSQTPPPAENNEPPPVADAAKKPKAGTAKSKGSTVKEQEKFLARTDQERFLQVLGTMSAAHVYQAYLNIGLFADGVESEIYTKAQGEEMLSKVVDKIAIVDRQLDKILAMNLTPDDKENIEDVQKLTGLLRRQASALRAYWATGNQEQATRYQKAREAAWTALSEFLNLE